MSEDKENYRTRQENEVSSEGKKALQSLSPNKTGFKIDNDTKDITAQLDNIDHNTTQASVDLKQLVDRLKNNNEHLNQLLTKIVDNSHITQQDLVDNFEQYKLNPRDVIDPIIEELQAVHLDSKSINLLQGILDRLSVERENFEWQDQIKDLVLDIKHKQEQQLTKTKDDDLSTKYDDLSTKYDDLEHKYKTLEGKYNGLCEAYRLKYESLQQLNQQYEQLIAQNNTSMEELKDPNFDTINNIEKLHHLKMDLIKPRPMAKKRIVSTPLAKPDE